MSDYESIADRARREERKTDEEHYSHVASAAARYHAMKSPERRAAEERLKASKAAKDAAFAASTGKPAGVSAPKAAKPAAAASTPKASTPKRDPEAEYLRGVANGRAAERTRISRVYDRAKVSGGDAAALRMLATTSLDSTAILAKLYGTDGSNSALGISGDAWGKAIANVYGQLANKGSAA